MDNNLLDSMIGKTKIGYGDTFNITDTEMYTLYADGGSRGNPGPSGSGCVIKNSQGEVMVEMATPIGHATNNIAEWTGVMLGVVAAERYGIKNLIIKLDSNLVVNQLKGAYRVKDQNLKKYYDITKSSMKNFNKVTIEHIRRELNKDADKLSNIAMDML